VLSVPSRAGGNYIRLMNQGPGNDIHVVNQFNSAGDQLALQQNPDYNLYFEESCHHPFPPRPFMFGKEGTALHGLRAKEQGDWKDLSMQEKEDLYRGYFDRPLLEQYQGTDMWKGIIGIIMISVALATQIDYMLCYNVFGWNPKEAGFWYWWQPGWQQMRKNEAAEHILWEYDAMGNQRDYQHWDYVNHQWKRPCMPRLDASY